MNTLRYDQAPDADSPGFELPDPWAASAGPADWEGLARWVDWLTATYDVVPSQALLGCWPAHPGIVEELAALRAAWRAAALAAEDDGELAYWHDRLLHPFLVRARTVYSMRVCADGHRPPVPRQPTNAHLLAQAAAVSLPETTVQLPSVAEGSRRQPEASSSPWGSPAPGTI
jgi:hypothetical protein